MKRKINTVSPIRLNFLFFTIFLAFCLLIMRLGYLQIVQGEQLNAEINKTNVIVVKKATPRGSIYDSKYRLLVGNTGSKAITYFREYNSASAMVELAERLTKYIFIDLTELKGHDLQAYFIAKYANEVNKRLNENEKQLQGGELYKVQLKKVTDQDLNALKQEEKSAAIIYNKMNSISTFDTVMIKNKDVTDEEVAKVSENLRNLPGINVTMDWEREYIEGTILKSIFGSVTSEKIGLPSDQKELLLARGYALNDRVGNSYLEKGYENVLKGISEQHELVINNKGEIEKSTLKTAGKKGNNLVLTIDIDFQKKLEEIATQALAQRKGKLADRLYICATNPQTGEVLGLTGKKLNMSTGEIEDDALGVFNTQYTMGSSIKAATVLAGYMDKVISLDENKLVDKPLKFAETKSKSSWFNRHGHMELNDVTAIEVSSNSYMMQLAMRMGGKYNYIPDERLKMNSEQVFSKLRYYYSQFGLGVLTGFDIPGETAGLKGVESNPGLALDLSFGQFDTYTTLQLNQYISTIANGGVRIAPRIVKEIRGNNEQGELGSLEIFFSPRILNHLDIEDEYINRVKTGLYNVVYGSHQHGTGKKLASSSYKISAKTGTAQAFYSGPIQSKNMTAVWNSTFVGYAPSDNPQIAISVALPYMDTDKEDAILDIPRKVFDAFFDNEE